MSWRYRGEDFNLDDHPGHVGFVYLIRNLKDNKGYIGKKLLTKAGYRQVNKKKKKVRLASDWPKYYGSNLELKEDVKLHGLENFHRVILRLCKTKSECNYWEAHYQFEYGVLLSDDWYNTWVTLKVRKHSSLLGVVDDGSGSSDRNPQE